MNVFIKNVQLVVVRVQDVKKQTIGRRAHSASEFPTSTLTAANKRLAYRSNRSHSSENQSFDSTIGVGKSTPQRVESFAKLLFPKR